MRGLMIKDMINLRSQFRIILLIIALWYAVAIFIRDAEYFYTIMIAFVIMMPITTMSYDEKYKWDSFALTMPIKRRTIVNARYLFVLLCLAAVTLLSVAGNLIISKDPLQAATAALYLFPAGLILNAVIMPVLFHFGVEAGRIMLILIIVAIGLITLGFTSSFAFFELAGMFSKTVWKCILWIAGILLSVCSLRASYTVYERKDF